MNLKEKLTENLYSFKNDMVFLNRFARHDDALLMDFTKSLYNNEILMRGSTDRVKYENFKNIDFLGPEIKHSEWVQQLNRFYWLKYCAIEYEKNKSDHMAGLVFDAISSWMNFWPSYGDRSDIYEWMCCDLFQPMMSTPLRLGAGAGHGWIGCIPYFFDHPLFTDEFVSKVVESSLWQIRPMVHNNKYWGNENNWRPNELSCLLFLSQVLPGAEGYADYAVEQINDSFIAQFENDGSHIEHTTDYHDWMADIFSLSYLLGQNRPHLGINIETNRILKVMDYGLLSKAPDGRQFGIHDSYAWHINNPVESTRNLEIRNYIAAKAGRKLFNEEYDGILNFKFEDAGQYFFITKGTGLGVGACPDYEAKPLKSHLKQKTNPQMVFFDASRWGSWHTHQSRNSVNFFYGNKMLLIDPGSLDYGNSPERWYGKLTPAHNTISINNLSQCPFSDPLIREYYSDDKLDFIISDYSGGYQDWCGSGTNRPEQGFYGDRSSITAAHERIFIWIKEKFMFVFDSVNLMENTFINEISSHWQFLEGDISHNPDLQSAHTCYDDFNVLIQKAYSNIETKSSIHYGGTGPMLGYNSKTGGKMSGITPAPMLALETKTSEDFVRFAQVIIPYSGEILPNVRISYEKTRYAILFNIVIGEEKFEIASHYFVREFFKTNSAIREIGDKKSMARLIINGYKDKEPILNWEYKDSKIIK